MSSSEEEGGPNGVVEEDDPVLQLIVARPLVAILDVVAQRRGMRRSSINAWVEAVRSKLEDIGVVSLREFLTNILVLNRNLRARQHAVLHETTLTMILVEVCEMVMGPEDEMEDETDEG
jgi:hypothetical protein